MQEINGTGSHTYIYHEMFNLYISVILIMKYEGEFIYPDTFHWDGNKHFSEIHFRSHLLDNKCSHFISHLLDNKCSHFRSVLAIYI